MIKNWICPRCGRDYDEKPASCKCLEPVCNFIRVKRHKSEINGDVR